MGCFADFVVCVAGHGRKEFCPHGLVFDAFFKRCVWPEDCHSPNIEQPITPVASILDAVGQSSPTHAAFCTMTSASQSPGYMFFVSYYFLHLEFCVFVLLNNHFETVNSINLHMNMLAKIVFEWEPFLSWNQ